MFEKRWKRTTPNLVMPHCSAKLKLRVNSLSHWICFKHQVSPCSLKTKQNRSKKIFETEGSTKFDDDKVLEEIKRHETEALNYGNLAFPSDFIYLTKTIPQARQSAE